MSTIKSSTTSTTAYQVVADTTGTLVFQTGATPTTAMTLGSDQSVTFAGTPTYSGGTANGVAYLNGSKVLTTGSALTFDGTALASSGSGTQSLTVTSTATAAYVQTTGANTVNARLQSNATTASVGTTSNHNFVIQTNANNVGAFDTNGNFGIGTTTPTAKLNVAGTSTNGTAVVKYDITASNNSFDWASTTFASNMTAGNNLASFIGQAGSLKNSAYYGFKYAGAGSSSNLLTMGIFGVDNILNVNGNGNVSLYGASTVATGVGITFPASASRSNDSNCLDDYETGNWTPTISLGGLTISAVGRATYTKVGNRVWLASDFSVTGTGNSDTLTISGLPFTVIGSGWSAGSCYWQTQNVDYWKTVALPVSNSATMFFQVITTAGSGNTMPGSAIGAGYVNVSAFYEVA